MLKTRTGLPRYCCWAVDRHGKRRVRFRRDGFSTYLGGVPWSPSFMEKYGTALAGVKAQASDIGASRTIAGTVNALVAAYLDPRGSSRFKTFASETQRTRKNILERFREGYGDRPIYRAEQNGKRTMLLTREHMQRIVNEKVATPFAQRNFLATLRAMFEWAVEEGRVPDNPCLGCKRVKAKTTGYKTWTEADIARIEAKYPISTKERLAFALILYSGLRRGDVVRMGTHHIHDGVLTVDQCKKKGDEGSHLEIPVHPKLRKIIDATPTVGVRTFLTTSFGKPYTSNGFGNWFRELCDAAGCPDISAHGGRKATARRLAEIGCSANQIAAITGHSSLAEVQRYTRAADRKRMAREAMRKLNKRGW